MPIWKKNWVQALISIFYYQLLMRSKRTSPHCMWKRKSQSELLAYQVKENFGNYLDVVGATNHHSLELYDFSNVDYILTTVPIDIPVPIPIIRTSTFFETSFIHQVNQAITDTRSSRFIEYFHKNMVFGSSSDDKNEILEHMCENAVQNYDIPDDFFHYVMKREEIGRTSDSSDRLGWKWRNGQTYFYDLSSKRIWF